MMKFKTKKEMTLPQLIEWAWENSIKHKEFTGSRNGIVEFDFRGWVRTDLIEPDEFFEVEVEEEITEDTKIPTLIELFVSGYGQIIHTYYRTSIRETIGEVVKGVDALPKAFYILNDDMTMTLIWKDGEMV
ncbi:hypothetical protein Q8V79_002167 [Staphylococcus pseudintermedius]|uniref:hypothetical protein n=1 Tax=Staphylococcus pseudintermedius TaxID=283734 RepID=UPI0019DC4DA5|nr:hypothetical protein [Staphylococcus pseudintermedius]EGQ0364147.1 hypothetical protein [Staphylococcus pseudintermedius]EGQ1710911.1 hypothetical protein [Staphylococcus pseudintermedius]EGQ3864252.1 hypothetical protein [Staphylococcus pseudintermedius]EGQ4142459.1 hypothetical protein [Staphylococcus pseudintermedius]EHT8224016.1 hypothetical protein [Staphylococcus pseudintermedius]